MPDVNQLVEKAIAAYKAKQKSQAREMLMQAVDLDDKHEQAWLWLSAVVDSVEDQQVCLENVLTINPQNERARKGLEELYKKQGKPLPPQFASPGAAPHPASTPPSSASGWDSEDSWSTLTPSGGGSAGRSNAFAGTGFEANPWGSDSNDFLYAGSGSNPSNPKPDAPATSVEWTKGGDKSAYGSGRQVSQPSDDEYDQWLASLNLGQGAASTTNPAAPTPPLVQPTANVWKSSSPSSVPVQGGAFTSDESDWEDFARNLNAAGHSQAATQPDGSPFGGTAFAAFGNEAEIETETPFDFDASPKAARRPKTAEPIEPFQVTTRLSDFADDENEPPSIFGDDEDPFGTTTKLLFDDDEDPFGDLHEDLPVAASQPAKSTKSRKQSKSRKSTISPEQAQYYAAIPADITAKAKSGGQGMMLMGTVVLIILNVVALVGLFMS